MKKNKYEKILKENGVIMILLVEMNLIVGMMNLVVNLKIGEREVELK